MPVDIERCKAADAVRDAKVEVLYTGITTALGLSAIHGTLEHLAPKYNIHFYSAFQNWRAKLMVGTAIVIGRAYFAGESKLYSAIQQEKIDKYGGKGVESLDKDL